MANPTKLTDPEVNSGTAVILGGTRIDHDVELNTNVPALPGTDPTLTFENRLSVGRNTGIGTSTIVVTGVWDANLSHVSGASALLDYEYFLAFANRSDQAMTLSDDCFITSSNATGTVTVYLKKAHADRPDTSNVRNFVFTFAQAKS